jgi:FAD dependent oxidoreductase
MSEWFDIAVIGGGAAGIAAAVSAARAGCRTLLLDQNSAAGGTGGFSGLTTLCGLFDDDGNFLNNGFPREFAETLQREDNVNEPVKMGKLFVQLYRPESFQKIAARLIASEQLIVTRWNTPLANVALGENRVQSVNGVQIGAIIDCTGNARVGRAAGESILTTNETTQASAVIFPLEKIAGDLNSPLIIAQILAALSRAGFPPLNFTPSADEGIVMVKFSGSPGQVPDLIDFLRRNVSGFEHCRTSQTQFSLARRAGAMIVGCHLLTEAEVLGARKFPGAIARGAWPVEQWSANGKQKIRCLPAGDHYEIPADSLRAARTENLFMAGKSLSADVGAIASARVMGCCLATGAAAGILAANHLKSNST